MRWFCFLGLLAACGEQTPGALPMSAVDAGALDAAMVLPPLYASEMVSFTPGPNASFGHDLLPDVVLGAPRGDGATGGSFNVASLGVGGSIVLGFGDRQVIDGPGADFVVFENPFLINDDPKTPYKELAAVAVSEDGQIWHEFACEAAGDGDGHWPNCAGWSPVLSFDAFTLDPLDPAITGGDPFDLADVPIDAARFVRIRDLSSGGGPPSAGFDLDAIGAIHLAR